MIDIQELRDEFAKIALSQLVNKIYDGEFIFAAGTYNREVEEHLADTCWRIADAMIFERIK